MDKRRSRPAQAASFAVETLEGRVVLSAIGPVGSPPRAAVEVAAQSIRKASTTTTLAIGAGTLGQPITFAATVRAAASAGSPTGTVNIVDHGIVIETLALSPTKSGNARYAARNAMATLTQPPGGGAYYFGNHQVSAVFIPDGGFQKSAASKAFAVGQPAYTGLARGVKVATIAPGSGPAIQSGQTANVMYTGYFASNGRIFDDSLNDGGTPLAFKVGAGEVVPGFDAGTTGMKVGESRIIFIPPAEGYGASANGPIPGNSTLLFVVTLESIS